MENQDIQELAKKYGLNLSPRMSFNEMGIDFRVVFASEPDGTKWLLRIPRRADLGKQITQEKRILQLVAKYLSVQVPDWQIANEELIAYPLLTGKPALTFDAKTYEVTWNMRKDSPLYTPTLAKALTELHAIPHQEALLNNLKVLTPEQVRNEILERLLHVKSELGMSEALENRYRQWLDQDALWPDFTKLIHGDLYAGHTLTDAKGNVSGIIDWSTAHVSDIAQDFAGQFTVFGGPGLKALITEYEKLGGEIWDKLFEQTVERAAAAPLAYGYFALETKDEIHLNAAKQQLLVREI